MIVQCCVCRRVRENGAWVAPPESANDEISHGYCPACSERIFAEIRERRCAKTAKNPGQVRLGA